MSAAIDEGDELAERRERRLGETFMSTFAAIGALLLLDAGKADAALPDPTTARLTGETGDPLRGAIASAEEEMSGPPAVSDSAFLEAITALSPPPSLTTDLSSSNVETATPDSAAPSDDAPSAQPDQAADDMQLMLPGSIAVIGSSQVLDHSGAAARMPEAGNEAAFAIGAHSFNVLSGAAAQSVLAGATLAGDPTQTVGGFGPMAQADGSEDVVGGRASLLSATAPGAGDRGGPAFESAMISLANPAEPIVADFVIDLPAPFALGALDLFALPTFVGGDRLGFVGPDALLTMVGVDKAEVADLGARSQIRLP